MQYYIGIDLAWKATKETGICILNDNKECIYLKADVYSNEEIAALINSYPGVTSVDAPLIVKNETGGRRCDSLLMRTKINGRHLKLYATSRTYMKRVFGSIRGEEIISKVDQSLKEQIIETYPTGIFLSLFPDLFEDKYKLSSRLPLTEVKEHALQLIAAIKAMGFQFNLTPEAVQTKRAYKTFEDQLDSVLCAINSYFFVNGQYTSFAIDDNGKIVLPRLERED